MSTSRSLHRHQKGWHEPASAARYVAWFSLRVREVAGSIPGATQVLMHMFHTWLKLFVEMLIGCTCEFTHAWFANVAIDTKTLIVRDTKIDNHNCECGLWGSSSLPYDYETCALPTALTPQLNKQFHNNIFHHCAGWPKVLQLAGLICSRRGGIHYVHYNTNR